MREPFCPAGIFSVFGLGSRARYGTFNEFIFYAVYACVLWFQAPRNIYRPPRCVGSRFHDRRWISLQAMWGVLVLIVLRPTTQAILINRVRIGQNRHRALVQHWSDSLDATSGLTSSSMRLFFRMYTSSVSQCLLSEGLPHHGRHVGSTPLQSFQRTRPAVVCLSSPLSCVPYGTSCAAQGR